MTRLRFFADHCISNAIMDALRTIGAEVLRLREHLPPDAPDEVVIATAQQLEAILVSLNGDFANIVTYPQPVIMALLPFRCTITQKLFHS